MQNFTKRFLAIAAIACFAAFDCFADATQPAPQPVPQPAPQKAAQPSDILAELAKSAHSRGLAVMEISQTKTLSFFGETVKSKMIVAVSADGKMRMQTVAPFKAASVFDGSNFARYEKSDGRWRALDGASTYAAKRIFGEMLGVFSGGVSDSDYAIERGANRAVLTPKNPRVRSVVARIEICSRRLGAETLLRSVSIIDSDGDSTILNVEKYFDVKNADGLFDTSKPELPKGLE